MDEPGSLIDRIDQEIRDRGPMRFDRFQELALYDSRGGYYERPGRVGRDGDFVTGSSWHPAFARCIARVARRLRLERDAAGETREPIHVVDVGCGEGELLDSVGQALSGPEGQAFRLIGVERSAVRREAARRRVPSGVFLSAVAELPRSLDGVVIGYELFDALPVRALAVAADGQLLERAVAVSEDGSFVFAEAPCADGGALRASLQARGVDPPPGQRLEVRPGARELARSLASRLASGLLLIFDYGAPARALYAPGRASGTLEAFLSHQVTRDVLTDPGSRDITAWVDFSELEEAAAEDGLTVRGLVSQSRFLLASGIGAEFEGDDPEKARSASRQVERNAVAKLFMPGGMGESLRVLVADRGTRIGDSLVRFPTV